MVSKSKKIENSLPWISWSDTPVGLFSASLRQYWCFGPHVWDFEQIIIQKKLQSFFEIWQLFREIAHKHDFKILFWRTVFIKHETYSLCNMVDLHSLTLRLVIPKILHLWYLNLQVKTFFVDKITHHDIQWWCFDNLVDLRNLQVFLLGVQEAQIHFHSGMSSKFANHVAKRLTNRSLWTNYLGQLKFSCYIQNRTPPHPSSFHKKLSYSLSKQLILPFFGSELRV